VGAGEHGRLGENSPSFQAERSEDPESNRFCHREPLPMTCHGKAIGDDGSDLGLSESDKGSLSQGRRERRVKPEPEPVPEPEYLVIPESTRFCHPVFPTAYCVLRAC